MRQEPCPECDQLIVLDDAAQVGTRIQCPRCAIELQVIGEIPFELDYAFYDTWDDIDWDDELALDYYFGEAKTKTVG